MELKEVQDFLNENQSKPEVGEFLNSFKSGVDLPTVQKFLETNDEGKSFLQSLTDSKVTKAISTYESKTLPKKVEDEITKRFPQATEEQKELAKLKSDFEKVQADARREKLLNKALSFATEKKIPTKFVDKFLAEDEENTLKNIEDFGTYFNEQVRLSVEGKFKDNGRTVETGETHKNELSLDEISRMSREELLKHKNLIK